MLTHDERKLLELIAQDFRLSTKELSIQTGLSEEFIEERIKQWEEEKVIAQYSPLINWERTGEPIVTALIDVKVLPQRGYGFDKIARRLQKFPEIKAVYLMSGGYDLSLLIEGRTMQEVALFVAEKLAPLEHVTDTTTHFILRRYKENGVELLGEDDIPERLVISP
ncbi:MULTISPECIES: Lrp/AsnC family transcriptional regulator [Desulfitobacterium]|uniref:Transcriptional regulator n=2 Tax=Desulfitobacterium dehalogenans TaxID=36854 RepID=I4A8M3_DESDJ|nr:MULTISPECIES: Lrp/AsnC family transcriptional regulator [Desulfitobacterium]AFM00308.1 transcriptional regulator [Desulfitobacterium dehalogenans ATCC 51507]